MQSAFPPVGSSHIEQYLLVEFSKHFKVLPNPLCLVQFQV